MPDRPRSGPQDKVAGALVDLCIAYALEIELDAPGISSGGDNKVAFELPAVTVKNGIHPVEQIPVTDRRKVREVGLPCGRIVSDQIIRAGPGLADTRDLRRRVCPVDLHRERGLGGGLLALAGAA